MPNFLSSTARSALVATALVIAGTGTIAAASRTNTASPTAPDAGVGTVNTIWGPVEVPVAPDVIVAVDEYAALGLLTIGHLPDLVLGPYGATVATALLGEAGVEVTPITYGDWNYELIADRAPDVIVLLGGEETAELHATLSEIAPTVVLPYVAPWREIAGAYGDLGDALNGTEGTADRIIAAMETRIDDVGDDVAGRSVSVLAGGGSFGTYSLGDDASTSLLLAELGMTRPPAQQLPSQLGVMLPLSNEQLGEHGADVLAMLGGHESFFPVDALQQIPTFEFAADASDVTVEVMGEMWTSSDPFAMWWVISDVEAIGSGNDAGTFADATTRWADYLAAIA